MDKKLRIGVIGVGSISQLHLSSYRKNPDVEICALCDIDEVQLQKRGKEYGVTALYTDAKEMLAKESLDAVSVCTWNSAHAPCTIAALEAGVNVLCEKPMALNAKEAEAMKAAAEKSGKLLMIGFVRRYGKDCEALKGFIDNGSLGDIYYAKVSYMRRNGAPGGWFGDSSRSGGGCLIDLGVHVIDYARYAMGCPKPVSVYGTTFSKLGNRSNLKSDKAYTSVGASDNDIFDVEDLATAMVRFDNGAAMQVETSFSLNMKEDYNAVELFGDKGGAKVDSDLHLFSEANGYMTNIDLAASLMGSNFINDIFQKEINHFVDCVKNDTPCRSAADDGLAVMKILDAVYESAKTGKLVEL